jgi:hypothetical protein
MMDRKELIIECCLPTAFNGKRSTSHIFLLDDEPKAFGKATRAAFVEKKRRYMTPKV